ncbi:Hypothetical protein A7982_00843 [Minicystis rosea]|nr:Hypothetical protein A7982_00843 [Minicystis rosea]
MMASSIRTAVSFVALGIVVASASAGCDQGSTSTGGSGGTGGTGGSGTTSSTGGSAPVNWDTACHDCLQDRCKAELSACDADCVALQGCLDTVCGHLSTLGASTEGQCQTQCQSMFPNAKAAHINVVNCAQGAMGTQNDTCMPPCAFALYDWEQCVNAQTATTCKSKQDACNASGECQTYRACVSGCTTNTECQACAQDASGQKGRDLYQAYWTCVADTCLAEGWLPHF